LCSLTGRANLPCKVSVVRRFAWDYVAAAIDRARPRFEEFIARHLECPEAVPLVFTEPLASICEIRSLKIAPRFRADFPEVDVAVAMQVVITARTRRRGVDLGGRTFLLDVALDAVGTTQGLGYDVVPQRARLTAWVGRLT
jgi:hypothetical protein